MVSCEPIKRQYLAHGLKLNVVAFQGNSLVLHCVPSTAHNIATSKMGAIPPTSSKRTNKGRLCRVKAFICNNNATDRLTASWFAIENKKMKETCVILKSAEVFHFAAVELWNY